MRGAALRLAFYGSPPPSPVALVRIGLDRGDASARPLHRAARNSNRTPALRCVYGVSWRSLPAEKLARADPPSTLAGVKLPSLAGRRRLGAVYPRVAASVCGDSGIISLAGIQLSFGQLSNTHRVSCQQKRKSELRMAGPVKA